MGSRTGRQFQRYNNQGGRQVVGCIPFRFRKSHQSSPINGTLVEEIEVLLISSQKSPKMMFPKGGWETDESIEQAVLRETEEEAGVEGIVGSELGTWSFKSQSLGIFHEGHMFPLFVDKELDVWPEQNVRRRKWMSVEEAKEACVHLWMKEALDEFICKLKSEALDEFICKLMPVRRKQEENRTSCLLEYRITEEPRILGIAAHQSGEEEVDCCLVN